MLAVSLPEAETSDLLARAIWVCNAGGIYKSFSPLQQALGRGPDSHGHLFEDEHVRPIGPDLVENGGWIP